MFGFLGATALAHRTYAKEWSLVRVSIAVATTENSANDVLTGDTMQMP